MMMCCMNAARDGRNLTSCRHCGWGRVRPRKSPKLRPWEMIVYAVADGVCGMKRPPKNSGPGPDAQGMPDASFASRFPTITEYLCCLKYDDGSQRARSALSLFVEDGVFKMAMNDKDTKRSLYVAAEGLQEAFNLMEVALQADNPPWRKWSGKK